MKTHRSRSLAFCLFLVSFIALPGLVSAQNSQGNTILTVPQAAKLIPDAVFFAGQSASTQSRNAGGIHFADGKVALAVIVDNSGYSTSIQQKYQGYLLTEVALEVAGHRLIPGAYGVGFVSNHFVVMDIGNHDLLQAPATHDESMHRPRPLQFLAGSTPDTYRLCFGRECVGFNRAQ